MGDLIHFVGHGLSASDPIMLANLEGGEGLEENTTYYVLASGLTADDFKVSLTDGGAAAEFTTDILNGSIVGPDQYDVVTDGVMDPPAAPDAPSAPGVASELFTDDDGHALVRATVTPDDTGEEPTRSFEVQLTREFTGGVTPVWSDAAVFPLAPGVTSFGINLLGETQYAFRSRSFDVYGQSSDWSSATLHTTAAGPDSTTVANVGATVIINEDGITILDGKLIFEDATGTTVLSQAGFGRPWLSYLYHGIYNATMENANQTDITVSEVSGGDTIADYEASISPLLPYWIVSASGGTLVGRTDASASAGQVLRSFNGSGLASDTIYQDIPVFPGTRRSLKVRHKGTITTGTADMLIWMSYRDINHGLIGTRDNIDTYAISTNADYQTATFFPSNEAPSNAAYVRWEVQVRHNSGSNILDIDTVQAPEDTDLELLSLAVDSISGRLGSALGITGPLEIIGDVAMQGTFQIVPGSPIQQGGATFPGSPLAHDIYYRSDVGMWFRYDGTRWVCTCIHEEPFVMTTTTTLPITATASDRWHMPLPTGRALDIRFLGFDCAFLVVSGGTALGASHKWNANIRSEPSATLIATLAIDSGASNTWRTVSDTGDDTVDATSSDVALSLSWGKTGTPGNLTMVVTGYYRYIGT